MNNTYFIRKKNIIFKSHVFEYFLKIFSNIVIKFKLLKFGITSQDIHYIFVTVVEFVFRANLLKNHLYLLPRIVEKGKTWFRITKSINYTYPNIYEPCVYYQLLYLLLNTRRIGNVQCGAFYSIVSQKGLQNAIQQDNYYKNLINKYARNACGSPILCNNMNNEVVRVHGCCSIGNSCGLC